MTSPLIVALSVSAPVPRTMSPEATVASAGPVDPTVVRVVPTPAACRPRCSIVGPAFVAAAAAFCSVWRPGWAGLESTLGDALTRTVKSMVQRLPVTGPAEEPSVTGASGAIAYLPCATSSSANAKVWPAQAVPARPTPVAGSGTMTPGSWKPGAQSAPKAAEPQLGTSVMASMLMLSSSNPASPGPLKAMFAIVTLLATPVSPTLTFAGTSGATASAMPAAATAGAIVRPSE